LSDGRRLWLLRRYIKDMVNDNRATSLTFFYIRVVFRSV